MTDPIIAQKSPYAVEVAAGKKYFWCACGQSKKQPFCDGAHTGTDISPTEFEATKNEKLFFCGCKQSKHPVLCDGSHTAH